jgi:O-antigen/teichoic acid export membrane protein
LGRDSITYGLGGVLARSITFITLPFYTTVFSTELYGELEIFILIGSFFAGLLNLGMDSTLSFFFTQARTELEKAKVVNTVLFLNISWGLICLILGLVFIQFLCISSDVNLQRFILIAAFFDILFSQSLNLYRLTYRPRGFVVFSVLSNGLNAGLSLILIITLDMGIEAVIWAKVIIPLILIVPSWYGHRVYLSITKIRKSLVLPFLKFGLPLFPQVFAVYIFSSSDRWMISDLIDDNALGIYSASAKFILIIAFATETFRTALLPLILEAIKDIDSEFIIRLKNIYFMLAHWVIILLAATSPLLLFFFVGPEYRSGFIVIAPLAFYPAYSSAFNIISVGLWKSKKTYISSIIMTICSVVNILLNLVLVPQFGIGGAAIATAISAILWIVLTIPFSEKYLNLGMSWKSTLFSALYVLSLIVVINLIHSSDLIIVIKSSAIALLVGLFFLQQYYFNRGDVGFLLLEAKKVIKSYRK